MTMPPLRRDPAHTSNAPAHLAIDTASHSSGRVTAVVSALALLFSGYSLWESSLKAPDIQIFVPPVIQYSSPYQNTNFEMFAVPVTFVNDGGRTGTVLSIDLEVTNGKTNETKRFQASDFGRWTMEKTRSGSYEPFAPISLAGKASRTETVLFYTKSPAEKPEQLVTEPGTFRFKVLVEEAGAGGWPPLDAMTARSPPEVTFEAELRNYDARAFQNGTLPLYAKSGKPAKSAE